MSSKIKYLFLVGLGIILFNSCNKDKEEVLFTGDEYQNILQYIEADENSFSKFNELIDLGGIDGALSSYNNHYGGNDYTLFLPTNDAVDRFIDESKFYNSYNDLLSDKKYVEILVRYHLLNRKILSNDFPNGALDAQTLSSDYLTVNYGENEQGNIEYKINDDAGVILEDVIKSNGVVHTIDKMLTPVAFTGYEWVQSRKSEGYSIFAELLELTGVADTMNYYELDEIGNKVYTGYTLFAESDELYLKNSIHSVDDLIRRLSPEDQNYTAMSNEVNKYVTYHILDSRVFLDQFTTSNFNTYGYFPISVDEVGEDLHFNIGTQVFEELVTGDDTTYINYLKIDISASNIPTKTGPVHQLDRLLFPFRPGLKVVSLEFYNEPTISALRSYEGTFYIPMEELEHITLSGPDHLFYTKAGSTINGVQNRDYISVFGDFEFKYQTPKILAGTYELSLRANRKYSNNAMIQIYVDGVKSGGLVDLTSGNTGSSEFSPSFILDNLTFTENEVHEIRIKTLKPGRMLLDRLILTPVSN